MGLFQKRFSVTDRITEKGYQKLDGNLFMADFLQRSYNRLTTNIEQTFDNKRRREDDSVARSRNDAVERALYECAVGSTRPMQKKYKLKRVEYNEETGRKSAEYEEIVDQIEEVYTPPSLPAMQFWLRSRMPERWGEASAASAAGRIELPEIGSAAPEEADQA